MTEPSRCLTCGYVLEGLEEPRCPECGNPFDLADPRTYSTKPLFVRWKFWLPGFLLAAGAGAALYVVLVLLAGWNVAVTLVAPFCIGAIVGYGCRVRLFVRVLFSLAALAIIVCALASLSLVGAFCGSVLAVVTCSATGLNRSAISRVGCTSASAAAGPPNGCRDGSSGFGCRGCSRMSSDTSTTNC